MQIALNTFLTTPRESQAFYASRMVRTTRVNVSKPGYYQPKSYHFFRFSYAALRGAHLPARVHRGPVYVMWTYQP